MKAVIYRRASTDEQVASGLGLDAQLAACRQWAQRERAEVVGPFSDEGVSGAAPLDSRPGLLDALNALGRGDVLLVARRDRLARDPVVVAMAEAAAKRRGARIVSAQGEGTDGDDPTSVLLRRIIDSFAEFERLTIAARTRSALQAKIRRGERAGGLRYGFDLADDGRTLVANADEQAALVIIRDLRERKATLRAIAAELNRRGIPSKSGGAWSHRSVDSILKRDAEPVASS